MFARATAPLKTALKAPAAKALYSSWNKLPPATLALKNGPTIKGHSFGAAQPIAGEVVFTTSLVGYPESMTDPSYRGQILVFTQPLVGNYGVPSAERDVHGILKNFESEGIHVSGIIVGDYSGADGHYSHWNASESLGAWCQRFGVPALAGVVTRALTKLLRQRGAMQGVMSLDGEDARRVPAFQDPNARNLVAEVSVAAPRTFNKGRGPKIAVVDCGVKNNILRALIARGVEVELLPWDFDFSSPAYDYDGLFVSNGPGDPRSCGPIVEHLRRSMLHKADRPIFGICMGNLLMGMAAGFGIRKLQYGNRGHNQPAINHIDGRCYITSQNHGYAVVDELDPVGRENGVAMPAGWMRLFSNANDASNEGLCHAHLPFSSVQFHPEARGGPRDTDYLFDAFVDQVHAYRDVRRDLQLPQHQATAAAAAPAAPQVLHPRPARELALAGN